MVKNRILQIVALLLISGSPLFAGEDAVITFVKGDAQVEADGKVRKVRIGETLSLSSTVITGKNSTVSLSVGHQQYIIEAEQKVVLSSIVQKEEEQKSFFSRLLGGDERRGPTVTAGVRGKGRVAPNRYQVMLSQKKYQELVDTLTEPAGPTEYEYLAQAHDALGHYDETVKMYEKLIEAIAHPAMKKNYYFTLALTHTRYGKYRESVSVLNKVLKEYKEEHLSAEDWYLLAKNYDLMGDKKNGEKIRKKIARYYPDHELTRELQ